eukprot:155399_1
MTERDIRSTDISSLSELKPTNNLLNVQEINGGGILLNDPTTKATNSTHKTHTNNDTPQHHSNLSLDNQSDHVISMSYLAVNLFNSFFFKYNKCLPSETHSETNSCNVETFKQMYSHKSAMDKQNTKLERQTLENIFDEYIDPDQNGDIDWEDWLLFIEKLNIELNETEIKKIFHCMNKDESGYIDQSDFVKFALTNFDNTELHALQTHILRALTVGIHVDSHTYSATNLQHGENNRSRMVIKHRTDSSLGNHLDLVNRMVSRWGSLGDDVDDLDTDYGSNNINKQKYKPNELNKSTDEMRLLKMERETLERVFDKYIDPDQYGDIDVEEWCLGIDKLNVQLNETQQRRIYTFMDKDKRGFIEKNDFVAFVTATFNNEELQQLQKPILEAVRERNLHISTDSNWTDYDSNDPNKEKQKSKSKSPNPNPPNPNTNNNNNQAKKPTHRRKKPATDEMKILKLEREALEGAFDQYIDPDQNGDVDVEEWFLGIQKLNVQLNEHQQRRIYNLMDKEESGFIEKDDFVTFATAKWDNEDLQTLQKPILEAVRVQNLHNRTHSNLMNPVLSQDWTDYDMELLEQEMASAMTGMVEVMQVEVNTELEFENEMKDRIEKNPELLDSSNAFKWTKFEVAHWITQLGMERYSRYFAQESVDGPMLLEDMTQEMLETNLGVRTIHAKKILREITTLKKAVRGVTDLLLDESEFVCTHNIDDIDMKIKQLAIHEELKKTQRQKDQLKKFYENELMKLNKIIIELKNGKKGKRKHKNKKNKVEEKIILPQPPMEYDNSMQSNDSIISPQFGMGVLTPLTENNQNKINNNDIIDENDNINVNENVDDDNNDNDNDNEENKEIENQIDIEQKQEDLQQEIKESDND